MSAIWLLTCCWSPPFLLWFWMKSTRPWTTVRTASSPLASCSHVGAGASVKTRQKNQTFMFLWMAVLTTVWVEQADRPGLGSMSASSSRWGLRRLRLAGSPVLWRAMVSSCTLWAKDAGVCSWNTQSHINTYFTYQHTKSTCFYARFDVRHSLNASSTQEGVLLENLNT